MGIDQASADSADLLDLGHEIGAFLSKGGTFRFMLEHIDGGAGQGCYSGMGKKDTFAGDGKEAMAKGLIGQDMIDADVDLIFILLHTRIFAQIGKKASLMEKPTTSSGSDPGGSMIRTATTTACCVACPDSPRRKDYGYPWARYRLYEVFSS